MKVVMLGWELPPVVSGGLGIACDGLLNALGREDVDVTFVVPWSSRGLERNSVKVAGAFGSVHQGRTPLGFGTTLLPAYLTSYGGTLFSGDIIRDVDRFAEAALRIVEEEAFDVVHAHDWMTFRAGVLLRETRGAPMLGHFHSTEHDRAPNGPNPRVCALEREGLFAADRVVTVSNYTRRRVAEHYGMDGRHIEVVHNGVDEFVGLQPRLGLSERWPRTVLFVGRLTAQKGPQYFLLAAERVLRSAPETRFILAGEGDMRDHLQALAEELGIADRVLFTGFLSRFDLDRVYSLANVCAMTSVSEPFGLVALEAMKRGIPVLVPEHAGVTEVVRNCRRIDHQDVDSVAREILDVLDYNRGSAEELAGNGAREVEQLTWAEAARKLVGIYESLSAGRQRR